MSTDARPDARILATGAEKVLPEVRVINANRNEERKGERERPGMFRRYAVLLAAMAAVSCGGPSEKPDEDADVGEAEADLDSETGPEADADSEVEQDSEADATEEDGEAEASCPTSGTVSENLDAPGTIGAIEQTITETYEVVTECDGSETRDLVELEIALASPASPEQLQDAIKEGAETILFGETVVLTHLGLDYLEYAKPVPGASGTVRAMQSVSDGTYTAIVQDISDTSTNIRVERGGVLVGYYSMAPGSYITLPDGRILMLTSVSINPMDPTRSTCDLAILEAPVRISDGERVERLGHGFFFTAEGDGTNLAALDFTREYT